MAKRKPSKKNRIWVLLDSKAGHAAQAKGVAGALGQPYMEKHLAFTTRANSPNWMKFPCFGLESLGVDPRNGDALRAPWPELVIACGRRTAPVARYIQKKAGADRCRLVQLLWPGFPSGDFSLIAVPEHDKLHHGEHLFTTHGAAHPLHVEWLQSASRAWEKQHGKQPSPTVALLVGGPGKRSGFPLVELERLAHLTRELMAGSSGSLLTTTSRRTPAEATRQLQGWLAAPPSPTLHFYDAHYPQGENPYASFLGLADAIIVTGDSISMVSEACGSGKPVFLFAPDAIAPEKHRRFHRRLLSEGYCLPLEESCIAICRDALRDAAYGKGRHFPRLDTARAVAAEIAARGLLPAARPAAQKKNARGKGN